MSTILLVENATRASVGMGQVLLARAPHTLGSVLGSCVGVALYHPRMRTGTLAHVVLPDSAGRSDPPGKFANTAIPHMIQLLAKESLLPSGLVAKIAGGSNMFGTSGPLQIGDQNIQAVEEALRAVRIPIAARDVGGNKGRRVQFDLETGVLRVEVAGQPVAEL